MNQVWINGRLASDPEAGASGSGVSYCKFGIAIERSGKDGKEVMFLDCVAFRKPAEFVAQYFNKGDAINVVGSISVRDWVDQSGIKHRKYEVIADRVGFPVSGKGRRQSRPNGNGRGDNAPAPVGAATGPDEYEGF